MKKFVMYLNHTNNKVQIKMEIDIEKLEDKYARKMALVLNSDWEQGHSDCDEILEELLEELGMIRTKQLYINQGKWYS